MPDDDNVVDRVEVWADALNDDEDDRPIDPVSKTNINPTECDEPTNTPTPGGPTNTPVPPTNTPDPSHTPTNTATPDPCD